MKNVDLLNSDVMGVASGRPLPTVRLSAHGGLGSFWVFGEDVQPPYVNATGLDVSLRSLTGRVAIPVPRGFSSWPYFGTSVSVNPIVPGASGSDPPRPLSSELLT
jgi:hypothetical protein